MKAKIQRAGGQKEAAVQLAIGMEVMNEHRDILQALADNPVERKPSDKSTRMKAKIQKIGNSLGVILPKEILNRHRISEGDYLTLSEGPSGVILSVYDEELQEELAIGDEFMRQYRDTFKALAT